MGSPASAQAASQAMVNKLGAARVDLSSYSFSAARSAILILSLVFFVGIIGYNTLKGRWRWKAGGLQDVLKCSVRSVCENCLGRNQRVTWFTCSSCFIAYYLRSVLSIVIMNLSDELQLEESTKGLALSAFFYGYIIANMCAQKCLGMFSARHCMLIAILGSSIMTMTLPLFVSLGGAAGLVVCRGGTGLLQGILFPSIYSVWAGEFMHDLDAKSRSLSFMSAMPSLGIAANFLGSPLLIEAMGWRGAVYIAGFLGLPWSLLWWIDSRPRNEVACLEESPCEEEKGKLDHGSPCEEEKGKLDHGSGFALVKRILCTPVFYAFVCGHFAHSWMTFVCMAWLPMYMRQELGISGESLSLSCLPYVVTAIAGPLLCLSSSWMTQGGDLWRTRRALGLAALLLPGAGALIFPQIPLSLWPLPLVVIGMALAFTTLVQVSVMATPLDIAGPQTSGLLFSMSNIVSSVPGFLGVQMVGSLRLCCGWPAAFSSCTVLYIIAAAIYARNGSAHRIFD